MTSEENKNVQKPNTKINVMQSWQLLCMFSLCLGLYYKWNTNILCKKKNEGAIMNGQFRGTGMGVGHTIHRTEKKPWKIIKQQNQKRNATQKTKKLSSTSPSELHISLQNTIIFHIELTKSWRLQYSPIFAIQINLLQYRVK